MWANLYGPLKFKITMKKDTPPPGVRHWQEKFNIEKNAKNKAYAFIVAAGLLDDFMAFSRAFADTDNWHELAITLLAKANKK